MMKLFYLAIAVGAYAIVWLTNPLELRFSSISSQLAALALAFAVTTLFYLFFRTENSQ